LSGIINTKKKQFSLSSEPLLDGNREGLLKASEARPPPKSAPVGTMSGPNRDQVEILKNCAPEKAIGVLMNLIGRTNRTKFRDQVLRPLLDAGFIEMTIPDKPTSSKQKYRLTERGKQVLDQAR